MNIQKDIQTMPISDDQKLNYNNASYLSAIGWTDEEIAGYYGLSDLEYKEELKKKGELYKAVNSGRLQKRAEIEIAIAKEAEKGDSAAVAQFSKIVRDKSFSISKLDLFGGADKEGAFEKIRDYISGGSVGDLSSKEQVYIDILVLIYSLDGQYGKRRTIKFLTSKPFNFTYPHATDMYAEAIELFFCNRKVSKDAMRQKMAEQFDSLYVAARDAAQNTKDYEIAANILINKAKALQLDKDDPEKLPADVYTKQYRVLSLTPKVLGLPAADRNELARQIDEIVAPEQVRQRLKMEAGVEDLDIVEILENASQKES